MSARVSRHAAGDDRAMTTGSRGPDDQIRAGVRGGDVPAARDERRSAHERQRALVIAALQRRPAGPGA